MTTSTLEMTLAETGDTVMSRDDKGNVRVHVPDWRKLRLYSRLSDYCLQGTLSGNSIWLSKRIAN